jgi:hypothetical protein
VKKWTDDWCDAPVGAGVDPTTVDDQDFDLEIFSGDDFAAVIGEEHCEPYQAAELIQLFLAHFDKPDIVELHYANTSQRSVFDGFGGGVLVISKEGILSKNLGQVGAKLQEEIKESRKQNAQTD